MKKLLSLTLALLMILSTATVFTLTTAAADGFKEGDVLYFKVENPSNWAQDATLYVNFTDASRTDNGGVSVIIADADKTKYNPVTGVSYDSAKSAYKYTVTAADAGASVMRFWRGNAEKLWNETVAITADDYAKGLDTAVVTDWSDTGYLTSSSGNAPATEAQTDPEPVTDANITAETANALYAHAGTGEDTEAWVKWYKVDDTYYFFLPSSVKAGTAVELYSSYSESAAIGGVTVPSKGIATLTADPSTTYTFRSGSTNRTVKFMFSSAEASLFVNVGDDPNFFETLKADKSNSTAATGAITTPDGTITNTPIKKMKGRGNTSWNADKKGFNVTFTDAVKLAGMDKCKKFSLISNFQDAAMARNRILYDLSDEVGIPYASDSRMIDLYTNGTYQGTYQMCQKVDVGKNTLMPDIDEEDYLDPETGGVKSDFSFVAEIDPAPADDDFHFTVQNGNNLTMKSPELEAGDPNLATVRGYIKNKFNTMFNKLNSNAADTGDYIDLDSLAKVYLINELGKNWDSGSGSFFLTYKPDETGKYKFYASPVWDYDNSLGNAKGVEGDLRRMGVSDYTLPSGWFSTVKNSNANFLVASAKNTAVMSTVYNVWFEDFLPAIDKLTSTGIDSGELYSSDVYRAAIKDSAAMNYKIWELVTNSSWVADHSSVRQYRATYTKNTYGQVTGVNLTQDSRATSYDQYTYDGQFDYMMDWTTSRAAWISAQYIANYKPETPTEPPTTEPTVPPTETPTEPEPSVTPYPAPELYVRNAIAAWVFDDADKTEGDKLTEYGAGDTGYAATSGTGTLTMTVDGENLRALEWSAPEYGPDGTSMTPIMAAGKNNLWGTPYIRLAVSTKGYQDIKLTMYVAGSNKAPATWKLQYSTDGTTFTDTGDQLTITTVSRKLLTAYINGKSLPAAAADQENLILRLVPVSMDTVSGGNTADKPSGGEIALNYIVVEGTKASTGERLYGDADMDGKITILDATRIQRYLADFVTDDDIDSEAADISGNGIDILDATYIQRYLADFEIPYPIDQPIK